LGLTATAATASTVAADPDLPLDLASTATIHLAKLGLDSEGTGRFVGSVDLGTCELTGNPTMNATETNVDLLGIRAATVGVEVTPVAPIAGHIDFTTFQIEATASFDIKVLYVRPFGIRWLNLVGNNCTTSEPTSITVTGTADPATFAVTLAGEFTIPKFKSCGLTTPILDLLISGPGNTFTSTSTQG
jgi:hypothetical protein